MLLSLIRHVVLCWWGPYLTSIYVCMFVYRCGNVAAIFELDEHLMKSYPIFEAAPNVSQVK